ncbi:MAG: hypothetical protein LBE14_06760, partial [Treponema sp.]|nr:hypothetical protein [Treponema sp.]
SAPVSKPPASQAPEVQETRVVESIQVINPPQQYTAPMVVNQSCFSSPLCIVILILLIIVTLLLGAIFFLLLNNTRRLPWWSWYYPVWVRRHIRYLKNRRY